MGRAWGGRRRGLHSSRALERIVSLIDRRARIEISVKMVALPATNTCLYARASFAITRARVEESFKDSPTRFGRSVQGRLQVLRL